MLAELQSKKQLYMHLANRPLLVDGASKEESISAVITSVVNLVPQRYLLEKRAVVDVEDGKLLNEDNDLRSSRLGLSGNTLSNLFRGMGAYIWTPQTLPLVGHHWVDCCCTWLLVRGMNYSIFPHCCNAHLPPWLQGLQICCLIHEPTRIHYYTVAAGDELNQRFRFRCAGYFMILKGISRAFLRSPCSATPSSLLSSSPPRASFSSTLQTPGTCTLVN